MGRIYLPLDVDFDDDDKVARLARYTKPCEARACRDLLVAMWRYCKRERSDGCVPVEVVGKLAFPDTPRIGLRDADRLVEVGIAERTPEGYYFPSYLKRNKSRAQLDAEAIKKAEAGRKGGKASGEVRKGEAEAKQSASAVLQPSEAKDRDKDTDRDSHLEVLEGERPEPLHAASATRPTCSTHPNGDGGTACGGCRAVREWGDRNEQRAKDEADRARSLALIEEQRRAAKDSVPMPAELRASLAKRKAAAS